MVIPEELIPIAGMLMVLGIVAIVNLVNIREKEIDVHQKLHTTEMEHQRKMRELELELQRIKQGS